MHAGGDEHAQPAPTIAFRTPNRLALIRTAVGRLDEFQSGTTRIVEVGSRSIGIVNTGDELFAVLNVCPHQHAPVCEGTVSGTLLPSRPGEIVYGMENHVIRCPWHGWEFDLETGKPVFRVDKGRLLTFPVVVEGGVVHIEMKGPIPVRGDA